MIAKRVPDHFMWYVLFAGLATIVDMGLLYIFTEFFGVHYWVSSGVSYVFGMITNFSLNKKYNFKNESKRISAQFSLFAAVAGIGLVLNQIFMYGLVEFFGMQYMMAKLVSVALVMFWSFFGHKHGTFKVFR